MDVKLEFVVPEEILQLVLLFESLPEDKQEEVLRIMDGSGRWSKN